MIDIKTPYPITGNTWTLYTGDTPSGIYAGGTTEVTLTGGFAYGETYWVKLEEVSNPNQYLIKNITIHDAIAFAVPPAPSVTPTVTSTPGASITPTPTVTPTVTSTPAISVTPTPTITPTVTSTPAISVTPTPTITPTPDISPAPAPSPSNLPYQYNINWVVNGQIGGRLIVKNSSGGEILNVRSSGADGMSGLILLNYSSSPTYTVEGHWETGSGSKGRYRICALGIEQYTSPDITIFVSPDVFAWGATPWYATIYMNWNIDTHPLPSCTGPSPTSSLEA